MSKEALVAEISSINALSAEVIKSIGRLHPSGSTPQLNQFQENGKEERSLQHPGYNHSIILQFKDKTEWVIKFPLNTMTCSSLMAQKVTSEVVTMKWIKKNTKIPVPQVHGFDPNGTSDWNLTRRPCIVMDKVPGRSISEKQWRHMKEPQQKKVISQVADIIATLTSHPFDRIGSLIEDKSGSISIGPMVAEISNSYLHGREHLDLFLAPDSPYWSATHYYLDLAAMRLLYEASTSQVMNEE